MDPLLDHVPIRNWPKERIQRARQWFRWPDFGEFALDRPVCHHALLWSEFSARTCFVWFPVERPEIRPEMFPLTNWPHLTENIRKCQLFLTAAWQLVWERRNRNVRSTATWFPNVEGFSSVRKGFDLITKSFLFPDERSRVSQF